MQNLSPIAWALRPLKRYAEFSGRSSRAEFWWFFLFMILLYVAFWIVFVASVGASAASGTQPSLAMIGTFGIVGILLMLFYLALLIPTIAVQVRRVHDTNRTGWWVGGFYLLYLIYMVVAFGSVFAMQIPEDGSPPNMGSFALVGIIALVMLIYSIVLLVFFCLPGTKGANRYGDDPYGANVEEVFA
jgi:uncharacterized membrane protein YhaH (DUF805 family)